MTEKYVYQPYPKTLFSRDTFGQLMSCVVSGPTDHATKKAEGWVESPADVGQSDSAPASDEPQAEPPEIAAPQPTNGIDVDARPGEPLPPPTPPPVVADSPKTFDERKAIAKKKAEDLSRKH